MHSVMITIEVDFDNPVSQDFYNKIIFSLNLSQIPCTCGLAGSLIWYGGYHRKVRMADHIILLRVARVFCTACGHTHALLLSSLVPYSQIPLPVQASVADCYEKKSGYHSILNSRSCIDENTISSIIRSYRKHWQQRIRSHNLSFAMLHNLIRGCFASFSRPFMQIKTTRNKIFLSPT